MRVPYVAAYLLIVTLSTALGLGNAPVAATYEPQVLISHIQVRSVDSASHEAIVVTNNSDYVADITGWCLHYTAAGSNLSVPAKGTSKVFCFDYLEGDEALLLDAGSSVTIFSSKYIESYWVDINYVPLEFKKPLSDSSGHLYLLDSSGSERDRVGWGSALYANGYATTTPASGSILQRSIVDGIYSNTNNNMSDFESIEGDLMSVWINDGLMIAFDICNSIPGVQFELPDGYEYFNDECLPISESDSDEVDDNGVDSDSEEDIDTNDKSTEDKDQPDDTVDDYIHNGVIVSEILPNPIGIDGDNEFIELHNTGISEVDLTGYTLRAGVDDSTYKTYDISPGTVVSPGGFWVVYSSAFGFNLVNTIGRVALLFGEDLVSQSDVYTKAPDGQTWALVDGVWVYTKVPTPGSSNRTETIVSTVSAAKADLKPCADNQYRSPETNRCRLLSVASPVSKLTPCKPGQERNLATNRCRQLVSTSSNLAPCKENQERNPDTNRCRQVLAATMPTANHPVEPVAMEESIGWGWWMAIGLAVIGLGYVVWEWRGAMSRWFTVALLKVRSLLQ